MRNLQRGDVIATLGRYGLVWSVSAEGVLAFPLESVANDHDDNGYLVRMSDVEVRTAGLAGSGVAVLLHSYMSGRRTSIVTRVGRATGGLMDRTHAALSKVKLPPNDDGARRVSDGWRSWAYMPSPPSFLPSRPLADLMWEREQPYAVRRAA